MDEKAKLNQYAMIAFQEFAASVSSNLENWYNFPLPVWIDTSFRYQGIVFSGLNTIDVTTIEAENFTNSYKINDSDITTLKDTLIDLKKDGGDFFHIMLAHHSPIQTSYTDTAVVNFKDFKNHIIKNHPPQILLHGHEHEHNSGIFEEKTLASGAVTATQGEGRRKADTNRGVTLVELKRENFKVKEVDITYKFIQGQNWPENTKTFVFEKDGCWKKNI